VEILKIGIIGFGEVGYTFSKAMVANGAEVRVYDILFESPIHKKLHKLL
jgi:3-hydroxyisobutyrate dehydrogenase-like beta-hydroxyacid dehydrogenase